MALDPSQVTDMFYGSLREGRRKREVYQWKMKVYKMLLDCYGLDRKLLDVMNDDTDGGNEDALRQEFYDVEELPHIWPRKVEVSLQDLLLRPLDNPAFKALAEITDVDPFRDGAGLIFPVANNGEWILHTLGHPGGTLGGKTYIITYANTTGDRDLLAEKLTQFIETRKGVQLQ